MFIRWLKESGVAHFHEEGEAVTLPNEVIDSLNPFDALIDLPEAPLSRIYNRTFFGRLSDTLAVLVGSHYDLDEQRQGRKGILDILIFPSIARRLFSLIDYRITGFYALSIIIMASMLEVARFIIGAAITLALSPVIAIVHLFFSFKSRQLNNNINNVKVTSQKAVPIEARNDEKSDAKSSVLSHEIKDIPKTLPRTLASVSLPELTAIQIVEEKHPNPDYFERTYLRFTNKADQPVNALESEVKVEFTANNIDGINAMLKTNWLGITKMLKKSNQLTRAQELVEKNKAPDEKTIMKTLVAVSPDTGWAKDVGTLISAYLDSTSSEGQRVVDSCFDVSPPAIRKQSF